MPYSLHENFGHEFIDLIEKHLEKLNENEWEVIADAYHVFPEDLDTTHILAVIQDIDTVDSLVPPIGVWLTAKGEIKLKIEGASKRKRNMKIVCAWCGKVLSDDEMDSSVSHGICDECMEKELKEIEGYSREKNRSLVDSLILSLEECLFVGGDISINNSIEAPVYIAIVQDGSSVIPNAWIIAKQSGDREALVRDAFRSLKRWKAKSESDWKPLPEVDEEKETQHWDGRAWRLRPKRAIQILKRNLKNFRKASIKIH